MITLALLKHLETQGFGTIGRELFWQKILVGQSGLYIVNLGAGEAQHLRRRQQRYELYSVADDDVVSLKQLEAVAGYLTRSYDKINELSDGETKYRFVVVKPPSTVSNLGLDNQGRVIYSITGTIIY